jgi:putative transposase
MTMCRVLCVARANQVWVTDITYIRTWQGWLYLAMVIDLFARNVVGWSMKPTLSRELALDALMMAVWLRKPDGEVSVHSDQGSQYGSDDWQRFCRANNLALSMSRRGNCQDNAVAESFFSSLKKERIRKRIYKTRDLARADIFDYIEVFYNRARRRQSGGLRTGLVVRTEFVYGRGVSPGYNRKISVAPVVGGSNALFLWRSRMAKQWRIAKKDNKKPPFGGLHDTAYH